MARDTRSKGRLARVAGDALSFLDTRDITRQGPDASSAPVLEHPARRVWFADEQERATALADADALEKRWTGFRQVYGADATVARFLGDIALAGRGGVEGPGVRVLTIHAAKGLEFRVVVLVGMNEGSFPDYRSKTVEEIADERRNAYVAITRAERALFLSRPRSRLMPWGDPRSQQVSRFLAEANLPVRDVP